MLDRILEKISAQQNISMEVTSPGVEVIYRGTGEDRVRIVINHNSHEAVYANGPLAPFQCCVQPVREEKTLG